MGKEGIFLFLISEVPDCVLQYLREQALYIAITGMLKFSEQVRKRYSIQYGYEITVNVLKVGTT